MEKVTYGQSVEKGDIVEINTPNKVTIKAVVLDVIEAYYCEDCIDFTYIMYAQNRIFKASQNYMCQIVEDYEDDEVIGVHQCEEWSPIQYDGTIIDYCEIPPICQTPSIRIASCL